MDYEDIWSLLNSVKGKSWNELRVKVITHANKHYQGHFVPQNTFLMLPANF